MKKLLLALPLLTLPLTAMAQDKPTQPSQKVIDSVAKTLTTAICKGGMKEAGSTVYECYKNTANNNPNIENCMVADYFMTLTLGELNNKAEAMGDPINNIPFFAEDAVDKRMAIYLNLPQYKKYTENELINYFTQSQDIVGQEIVKLQQSNFCDKK